MTRFTVNDGLRRETIDAADAGEAKMAFVERHDLAPDEHDFVAATPVPDGSDAASEAWADGGTLPWDALECPACGGADIDLAESSQGPLFECQECGEAFDPKDEGDRPADRSDKPPCLLVGSSGNVFSIIGNVARCLRDDGQRERAKAWVAEATSAKSYDEVLQSTFRFVDPL